MLNPIDLTLPIQEGMLTFDKPWHVKVAMQQLASIDAQGRETRSVTLGTHTGTHVDAPRHFIQDGPGLDEIPLEALAGKARLLDFTRLPPLTAITSPMLQQALDGIVPCRLVLRFNWDRFWGSGEYYKGHPYLGVEAAQWLAKGGLRLLGMDSPMPDNPEPVSGAPDSPVHKVLLSSKVVLLEYLCNLSRLQSPEITIFALPLKLIGADGGPARCIAYDGVVNFAHKRGRDCHDT